jgi:hypothetical protein
VLDGTDCTFLEAARGRKCIHGRGGRGGGVGGGPPRPPGKLLCLFHPARPPQKLGNFVRALLRLADHLMCIIYDCLYHSSGQGRGNKIQIVRDIDNLKMFFFKKQLLLLLLLLLLLFFFFLKKIVY